MLLPPTGGPSPKARGHYILPVARAATCRNPRRRHSRSRPSACFSALASPSLKKTVVWLMGDDDGARQRLAMELGFSVLCFTHSTLQSQARAESKREECVVGKPALIWARVFAVAVAGGNRHEQNRAWRLAHVRQQQLHDGRAIVMEGEARSWCWDLPAIRVLERHPMVRTAVHWW